MISPYLFKTTWECKARYPFPKNCHFLGYWDQNTCVVENGNKYSIIKLSSSNQEEPLPLDFESRGIVSAHRIGSETLLLNSSITNVPPFCFNLSTKTISFYFDGRIVGFSSAVPINKEEAIAWSQTNVCYYSKDSRVEWDEKVLERGGTTQDTSGQWPILPITRVAAASLQNLVALEQKSLNTISVHKRDGTPLWKCEREKGYLANSPYWIQAFSFDTEGNLLVAFTNRIEVLNPLGHKIIVIPTLNYHHGPIPLAVHMQPDSSILLIDTKFDAETSASVWN